MKKIVFLIGESGSGKSTLQNKLIQTNNSKFTRIISTTTRDPREGEVDGLDYHFTKNFVESEMTQYVEFGGNKYGTKITEYSQEQEVGLFVATPEGVNDTRNALKKHGIELDYEIVFFNTSDELLKKHGIPEERIKRGNLRGLFTEFMEKGEFDGLKVHLVHDNDVNENIHTQFLDRL